MKTSTMKHIAILVVTTAILSLTSCAAGSEDIPSTPVNKDTTTTATTENAFSLKVALVDNEGEDITTRNVVKDIALFVFDKNEKFYSRINIDAQSIIERREVKITCPGSDQITVIAWGGLTGNSETIANLSKGSSSINDFTISLNHEEGIANPTGDIFYGQHIIRTSISKSTTTTDELVMERKAASISLTTSGITSSKNDIFSYKIKNTKSAFNYNGELTGEVIEYVIPASFDKKGNLTMSTTSIFPSSEITIELYKNDELIFSAQKDENSRNLAAKSGKLLDVFFNYNSTLSIQTVVVPWGSIIQNVTIGG